MSDLWTSMQALVRQMLSEMAYYNLHVGQIVSQSSDLATCDLRPDNPAFGDVKNARIYWGLSGAKARIVPGGRCLFGWANGDPSQPFCCALDSEASEIQLGDASGFAVVASLLEAKLASHTHTSTPAGGPTSPPVTPITGFASMKVKV